METPSFIINGFRLSTKQVLFFYEIAVFFVCNDDLGKLYLAYCSDIDELRYSIVPVTRDNLIKMLDNEISMEGIFSSAPQKWKANIEDFDLPAMALGVAEFDKNDMPKKDAKYGKLDASVQEFLDKLKAEIQPVSVKAFSSRTFFEAYIEKSGSYIIETDWVKPISRRIYKQKKSNRILYNREDNLCLA